MNDLSIYKLNSNNELDKWIDTDFEKYKKFYCKVFNYLDSIPCGVTVNINDVCKVSSLELFVKLSCLYISLGHDSFSEILFTDERYTQLKRYELFQSKKNIYKKPK